jgi:hypothetical protein
VRLQVGFTRRYDPAYRAAKLQIDAGKIGEPVIFKSVEETKDALLLATINQLEPIGSYYDIGLP